MRMGCFCVPIVSLSFWVRSVIAACDLWDPCVLYEGEVRACVRPCGCCFFFFACELTRESRTKLGLESRGFVLLPELGNHVHLRFGSQQWSESDLSELDSINTAGIQQSVWRGLGFFLPARILPVWVFRPSQRNIRCIFIQKGSSRKEVWFHTFFIFFFIVSFHTLQCLVAVGSSEFVHLRRFLYTQYVLYFNEDGIITKVYLQLTW